MSFGECILRFRAKHNLSQGQLSNIIGVSVRMILNYEKNLTKPHTKNEIMFLEKMKEWEKNKNENV